LLRAEDKAAIVYQRQVVKDEQVYVKEHNAPCHGLGGSYHEKRRNKKLKAQIMPKLSQEKNYSAEVFIF
jgi:hypothetical protein